MDRLLLIVLVLLVFCLIVILTLLQNNKQKQPHPLPITEKEAVIIKSPPTTEKEPIIKPPAQEVIVQRIPPPMTLSLNYQQIGILTSDQTDKEPIVLPLFGRKIRSDRWQYYTATDKTNMLRLPLRINNRDCEDTIGCDEIYTGDELFVEIYQGRVFTATIYKIDAPQYFASVY